MNKRIAIYLTNPRPDNVDLDDQHYGEMFEEMLRPHMLGANFEHFDTVNNEFPSDPTEFDGVVITGSSAFVTDNEPWIETLFAHIRLIDQSRTKLFAVCFGHQAVAMAMGGVVEHRDIVLGAPSVEVFENCAWMEPSADTVQLFAGNFQQVVQVPESLRVIGSHPDCPVAMTTKSDHILTVQFHPEFSALYMHTYVDQIANDITVECATSAREAFEAGSDGALFAKWAAAFLTS